jgi:UDP-glucuronate 4-epimerase
MEPVTLNEVIQQIEQLLGKPAKLECKPFHKADILETQADISKATRLLGWRPSVSLNQGIQKTVDWYVRNHDEASCYSLP